jgi:hypothetical protein
MKAILSLHHPNEGAATRAPEVHGVMPPGLTLLGFRDAQRLAFRDAPLTDRQPATGETRAVAHRAFTALVAIGSIALLAFGR